MQSFYALRMTENEFVDFKPYKMNEQFTDIARMCYRGYARNDKVLMARSLSEQMFSLLANRRDDKDTNPFLNADSVTLLQCRIYSAGGSFMPEEQWAQVTVRQNGQNSKGEKSSYIAVYERRMSDKVEYFDWKISLMAEESEFEALFDEKTAAKTELNQQ